MMYSELLAMLPSPLKVFQVVGCCLVIKALCEIQFGSKLDFNGVCIERKRETLLNTPLRGFSVINTS